MLVGLTGGIGSGKTAASNAFAKLGVPIVDTDIIAREILQIDPSLLDELVAQFGKSIIDNNAELDREKLRDLAFKNDASKAALDAIMHPAIRRETLKQISQHANTSYCIVVVPLLIETNFKDLVDRVLVVTAPMHKRLKWLNKRSNLSEIEAKAIISKQVSDEVRLSVADDHISNYGTLNDIDKQVTTLHQHYLTLSLAI